jgi:hypothetical protein
VDHHFHAECPPQVVFHGHGLARTLRGRAARLPLHRRSGGRGSAPNTRLIAGFIGGYLKNRKNRG